MRLLCRPRSTARGARQGRGVVSAPQPQITTPQPHHNHKSQRHHNNNNSRSGRINFVRKLAFPGWGDAFVTFGAAWHAVFLVGGCFFFWSASLYIYISFIGWGLVYSYLFFLYIYILHIYIYTCTCQRTFFRDLFNAAGCSFAMVFSSIPPRLWFGKLGFCLGIPWGCLGIYRGYLSLIWINMDNSLW